MIKDALFVNVTPAGYFPVSPALFLAERGKNKFDQIFGRIQHSVYLCYMLVFHGSYKKISSFLPAPIWGSNTFDTANEYIIGQSVDGNDGFESGGFGYMYVVDIPNENILFVEDFDAVDGGEILAEVDGGGR